MTSLGMALYLKSRDELNGILLQFVNDMSAMLLGLVEKCSFLQNLLQAGTPCPGMRFSSLLVYSIVV